MYPLSLGEIHSFDLSESRVSMTWQRAVTGYQVVTSYCLMSGHRRDLAWTRLLLHSTMWSDASHWFAQARIIKVEYQLRGCFLFAYFVNAAACPSVHNKLCSGLMTCISAKKCRDSSWVIMTFNIKYWFIHWFMFINMSFATYITIEVH